MQEAYDNLTILSWMQAMTVYITAHTHKLSMAKKM